MTIQRWAAASLAGAAVTAAVFVVPARAAGAPTGAEVARGLDGSCPELVERSVVVDASGKTPLGVWAAVQPVPFPDAPGSAPSLVRAHAVDPADPRRVFVSDGASILRSVDGGCTWRVVHRVPDAGPAAELPSARPISSLHVVPSDTAWVWALAAVPGSPISVVVSEDGGETWEERGGGSLPPSTQLEAGATPAAVLAPVPDEPDNAYLAVNAVGDTGAIGAVVGAGAGPVPALWQTVDGGRTWSVRGVGIGVGGGEVAVRFPPPGGIREMHASYRDSSTLYAADAQQVWKTEDRGASWTPVDEDGGGHRGLSVTLVTAPDPDAVEPRSDRVVFLAGATAAIPPTWTRVLQSIGGSAFHATELRRALVGDVAGVAPLSADRLLVALRRPDAVVLVDLVERDWVAVSDSVVPVGDAPVADTTSEPALWLRTASGFAVFVPGPPPVRPRPPLAEVAPGGLAAVTGAMTPASVELRIEPGGRADVPMEITVPAQPTPVDVWFLVDTSSSMEPVIEALQEGLAAIVDGMRDAGLDAHFGLASYGGTDIPYLRHIDVTAPGAALTEAIDGVAVQGNGSETQLEAIYQSVTGAGNELLVIEPGENAHFRPSALKVIVHATDEGWNYTEGGAEFPDVEQALQAARVRHLGLDFSGGSGSVSVTFPPEPNTSENYDNLAALAEASGALAPIGGTDCDGDGEGDLAPGEPLVCTIQRAGDSFDLAPVIVSLVRAVREEAVLEVVTVARSGTVDLALAGAEPAAIDLKRGVHRAFTVTFTCPVESQSRVGNVDVVAAVRGAAIATTPARITCAPVPAPRRAPRIPPPPGPLPAAPVIMSPVQPVPELQPAADPNTMAQAAAAPAPTPAIAVAPGEAELAYARTGGGGDDDSAPDPTVGVGAALLAAGATAAVMRNRPQEARNRR